MAAPGPRLHGFERNAEYDCVIVGAGITGCATALCLAESGARVCVLDAASPGAGTSGQANGQVMGELSRSPDTILKRYGARGEDVLSAASAAPDLVFHLVARHAIACNAERCGWIEGTPWSRGVAGLEARVASWRVRGAPVELLGRDRMEALVGSRTYVSGILDRRAGTLDPLSYTRGLARAAMTAGAIVSGEVDVLELLRQSAGWLVRTAKGDTRGRTVVVATNAYTGGLLPGLRYPVIGLYGVQSATAPLPGHLAHILPQRHGFSDVRKKFFRLDPQGRLVVGGPAGLWPPRTERALPFRWIEHGLRRIFPELRDTPFHHRWYAKGAATVDLIPHLFEPVPGLFAALGYAGRGIAMGTMLGSLLAQRVSGVPADKLPFPTTSSALPLGLARVR